jgi:phospholipase C
VKFGAEVSYARKRGTIDNTSVLKMIELRWRLDHLMARHRAVPDLTDALTLATPRDDDPLQVWKFGNSSVTQPAVNSPRRRST